MLPRPTQKTSRIHLGVRSAQWPPAGASGDLLEVVAHRDGALTLLLADVCGNGAAAAPLAETFRAKARVALSCVRTPGALLAVLGDMLHPIMPLDSFVAAVAIFIDADGRTMRTASAGNLGPYVRRKGAVIACNPVPSGPPLGIFARIEYPETRLALQLHDLVICATDGVTDAFANSADASGDRGLRHHIEGLRDEGSLCQRLIRSATSNATDALAVTIQVGPESRKDSQASHWRAEKRPLSAWVHEAGDSVFESGATLRRIPRGWPPVSNADAFVAQRLTG